MTPTLAANAGALIASCLFGASVVATRVAVREVPPLSLAVLRFGQGGLVLLAIVALTQRRLPSVRRQDRGLIVLLGGILYALFPFCFNAALQWTDAAHGALMLATMPLFSAVLSRLAGHEAITPRLVAGLTLSLLGIALVVGDGGLPWQGDRAAFGGNLLILFTAALGALYGVLAKPLLIRLPPLVVTTYTMLAGVATLLPLALLEGLPGAVATMPAGTAALVLYLGLAGGALGFFLITHALAHLSPTRAAIYINVNPVVAALLAALWLDERLTPLFGLGAAAVLGGVALVNWPARKQFLVDVPATAAP